MMNGYIGAWNHTDKEKLLEGRKEKTFTGTVCYLIRPKFKGDFVVPEAFAQNTLNGKCVLSGND